MNRTADIPAGDTPAGKPAVHGSGSPCATTPRSSGLRTNQRSWRVRDYDLAATLESGQAFRWRRETRSSGSWSGVIGSRWVRLSQEGCLLCAETALPTDEWEWLTDYLQLDVDLEPILTSFPPDPPLVRAVAACRGLRLLRQEPWECLASFILSSTKQIVQIQQIIATLCERYGAPVAVPTGAPPAWRFPSAQRLAGCTEADLRACKAGFRASYLRATAGTLAADRLDLDGLARRPLPEARTALMALPGVGRKIADCVLLFALGFSEVFPMDVWVGRALREWYPLYQTARPRRLLEFGETHFGSYGGYAQQYLFHYRRAHIG